MEKNGYRELAYRLKVTSAITLRIVHQEMEKRLREKNIRLSPLSIAVIRIVSHKPKTIVELSRHMMIAPASLVPIINLLEKDGLVKRGRDSKDRRRSPISVTKKGSGLLSKISTLSENNMLANVLERIGERRSKELLKLSEEVLTSISPNKEIYKSLCDMAKAQKYSN